MTSENLTQIFECHVKLDWGGGFTWHLKIQSHNLKIWSPKFLDAMWPLGHKTLKIWWVHAWHYQNLWGHMTSQKLGGKISRFEMWEIFYGSCVSSCCHMHDIFDQMRPNLWMSCCPRPSCHTHILSHMTSENFTTQIFGCHVTPQRHLKIWVVEVSDVTVDISHFTLNIMFPECVLCFSFFYRFRPNSETLVARCAHYAHIAGFFRIGLLHNSTFSTGQIWPSPKIFGWRLSGGGEIKSNFGWWLHMGGGLIRMLSSPRTDTYAPKTKAAD